MRMSKEFGTICNVYMQSLWKTFLDGTDIVF